MNLATCPTALGSMSLNSLEPLFLHLQTGRGETDHLLSDGLSVWTVVSALCLATGAHTRFCMGYLAVLWLLNKGHLIYTQRPSHCSGLQTTQPTEKHTHTNASLRKTFGSYESWFYSGAGKKLLRSTRIEGLNRNLCPQTNGLSWNICIHTYIHTYILGWPKSWSTQYIHINIGNTF